MINQRICVGCRVKQDKKKLLRVVRDPLGQVKLDLSGKNPGRGAYICANESCMQKAQKKHLFERVLKVKTEDVLWQQLLEEIKFHSGN
ncbi:MAG: YlxR family protein [Clostridiales bacterium]|nr:YlxR family protein [Clostridiales bacterium]